MRIHHVVTVIAFSLAAIAPAANAKERPTIAAARCAKPLGTVTVIGTITPIVRYGAIDNPQALVEGLIRQSGCFKVIDDRSQRNLELALRGLPQPRDSSPNPDYIIRARSLMKESAQDSLRAISRERHSLGNIAPGLMRKKFEADVELLIAPAGSAAERSYRGTGGAKSFGSEFADKYDEAATEAYAQALAALVEDVEKSGTGGN